MPCCFTHKVHTTHHTLSHLTTSHNNALLQPLALYRTHSFTQSLHTRNCDGRLAVSDCSLELLRLPAFGMAWHLKHRRRTRISLAQQVLAKRNAALPSRRTETAVRFHLCTLCQTVMAKQVYNSPP